jgi:hypothetical protein
MRKKILAFVVIYLVCGIYAYGTAMAELHWYSDNEWTALHLGTHNFVRTCALEGALGPGGAVAMVMITNFNQHGWRMW